MQARGALSVVHGTDSIVTSLTEYCRSAMMEGQQTIALYAAVALLAPIPFVIRSCPNVAVAVPRVFLPALDCCK